MPTGLAIISDDFTGGLMVASHLEQAGIACPYISNFSILDQICNYDAVVIATRSRFLPAEDAVRQYREITDKLDQIGVTQIFFKYCATFDSTAEGNIGPCADFLTEKYGLDRLVFCPGFPDFRIFVHEGYMFYKDRLISESIKRFDPLTPMADPDMARVLQSQTPHNVGLLPHRILHEGPEAAKAWLNTHVSQGVRYFMMDSVDNDDINCGAALTYDWPVMTGGDGIAIALGIARSRKKSITKTELPAKRVTHVSGRAAVLAGSCGIATLEQLDHFEKKYPVLRIDLMTAARDPKAVDKAIRWAALGLESGPVALTTAAQPDEVKKTQNAFGVMGAARTAEAILGRIAVGLHGLGVRQFIVSGGETSGAVVTALGVNRMQVAPFDDLGAGQCVSVDPEPISFFLKPGKIGTVDVFERALTAMATEKQV